MNELEVLEVKVQQEVGLIKWNYEELKTALGEEMQKYKNLVYDDSSIPSAKSDVALLRKLRKAVEDRRKEIKNKCLEPYELIEQQAKELTVLIDEPIEEIDKQVKAYEEQQKKAKREEILAFMDEAFSDLPQEIITKLKNKTYDTKWENKTAKKKDWQDAVTTAHDNIKGDIQVLEGVEEDFKADAYRVYFNNLVLSEALNKVNELRRQKEMILERERQRREAEERRKAEEERRKAEQAARIAQEEAQKAATPVPSEKVEEVQAEVVENPTPAAQTQTEAVPEKKETDNENIHRLIVEASREQMAKITGYIEFVGAKVKEV